MGGHKNGCSEAKLYLHAYYDFVSNKKETQSGDNSSSHFSEHCCPTFQMCTLCDYMYVEISIFVCVACLPVFPCVCLSAQLPHEKQNEVNFARIKNGHRTARFGLCQDGPVRSQISVLNCDLDMVMHEHCL